MSTLTRRKENWNRSNPSKILLKDVEISATKNNLNGEVTITVNSNADEGEDKYRLTLSKEEVNKIAWIWKNKLS